MCFVLAQGTLQATKIKIVLLAKKTELKSAPFTVSTQYVF